MELPAYHWPKVLSVLRYAFGKAMSFVKRAGTIIFSLTVLIWFMSNYNFMLQNVDTEVSILATLGKDLSWIFEPLGFGNWQATVLCSHRFSDQGDSCCHLRDSLS